ncbi:hypothetical protein [Geodermatophilus sp. URMC 63]
MGLRTPRRRGLRVLSVVLFAALCAALALLVCAFVPPQYSSTARLVASAGTQDEPADDRAVADQVYARTFARVLGSPAVADRVAARLDASLTPAAALDRTSFSAVEGTAVVEVTAEGPTARGAADLATAWAQVAAEEGADLVGVRDAALDLASPAAVPRAPERPRPLLYSGLAATGGALLAAGVLLPVRRRGAAPDDLDDLDDLAAGSGGGPPPRESRLRVLVHSRLPWLAAGAAVLGAATAAVLARSPVLPAPLAARVALGLAAGAVVGAGLALAALVVHDRSRGLILLTADAVQATGADVVVHTAEPRGTRAAAGADMRFRDLEPYRELHRALAARPDLHVVLVVGDSPRAGAGVRSIDVAVAGANAGVRTVLVGSRLSGHTRSAGEVLRDTLDDEGAVAAALLPTDRPRLRVLPFDWPAASDRRGRAALESRRLPLLVDRLLGAADLVVLAGPPLTEPEVPLRLAAVSDAAVLVVVAGELHRRGLPPGRRPPRPDRQPGRGRRRGPPGSRAADGGRLGAAAPGGAGRDRCGRPRAGRRRVPRGQRPGRRPPRRRRRERSRPGRTRGRPGGAAGHRQLRRSRTRVAAARTCRGGEMTEQDGRGSGRREVEVDALFAAQQSERRRQRLRVAAVTTAALAAGGLVGGLAAGVIDGDDGGRPSADGVGTSAGVSPEATASASSGAEGSEDAGSSDAADSSLPGSEATGQPGDDEVSSLSPAPGSGGGLNGEGGDSSQGGPSPAQPGGTAEQSPTAPTAQPARHVVQVGESLWTITAQLLGDEVSAQQVLDRWPEVYAANRDLIGPDPDLLRPGQELVLPQLS